MKQNIFFNILSVLVSAFVFFISYKYAILKLGTSQLGVWSLVVAFASFSKIVENGITVSTIRMTAHVSSSKHKTESILVNALVIGIVGIFLFNTVLYYVIDNLAPIFYDKYISELVSILLFSVLLFGFINSISMILVSVLEGMRLIRLKLIATIVSGLIFLVVMFPLIAVYGLRGLVYTQIVQSIVFSCILIIMLLFYADVKIRISMVDILIILKIIKFSRSTQLITLSHLLSEPLTKVFLAYFGSSNLVAIFDMVLKLINQLRGIVVAGNQVVIPVATRMFSDANPEEIKNYYLLNLKYVYYAGCIIYFPLIILSPEISHFWLGVIDIDFIVFLCTLTLVNWFNIFTIPGYYLSISGNVMKWNTIGHLTFCGLNILLGLFFGYFGGGLGVYWGYLTSLLVATLLMLFYYSKQYQIGIFLLVGLFDNKFLFLSSVFSVVVTVFNSNLQHLLGGIMQLLFVKIGIMLFGMFLMLKKYNIFKRK